MRGLVMLLFLAACGGGEDPGAPDAGGDGYPDAGGDGYPDADGDGYPDAVDAFPSDASEWSDLDDDGVGDNADALPADPDDSVDADGDGWGERVDCADDDPAVSPGADEIPYNAVDDDCDASTLDDDLDGDGVLGADDCNDLDADVYQLLTGYLDVDHDGYGTGAATEVCSGATLLMGWAAVDGDCAPDDVAVNPDAQELPYNGIDEDCLDGDEWDADGDGYTVIGAPTGSADDCADLDPATNPGATDTAGDALDQDCAFGPFDADGDGDDDVLGDDCDDADPERSSLLAEVYDNQIDDDCDPVTLDDVADHDGDGFDSVSAGGTDCDDTDTRVNPGHPDLPDDGLDNDCSGAEATAGAGVYVDNSSPDCTWVIGGGGTRSQPYCSIDLGFRDLAGSGLPVYLAGGPYEVPVDGLWMSSGLHGGYDSDWRRAPGSATMLVAPIGVDYGSLLLVSEPAVIDRIDLHRNDGFPGAWQPAVEVGTGGQVSLFDSHIALRCPQNCSGSADADFVLGSSSGADIRIERTHLEADGPALVVGVDAILGDWGEVILRDNLIELHHGGGVVLARGDGTQTVDIADNVVRTTGRHLYYHNTLAGTDPLQNYPRLFILDDVHTRFLRNEVVVIASGGDVVRARRGSFQATDNAIDVLAERPDWQEYPHGFHLDGPFDAAPTLRGNRVFMQGTGSRAAVLQGDAVLADNLLVATTSASGTDDIAAVEVGAGATDVRVTRSVLDGGRATSARATGLLVSTDADVVVTDSAIVGGEGAQTTAVEVTGAATLTLAHNVLHGGDGADRSRAVRADASASVVLLNNVIDRGTAPNGSALSGDAEWRLISNAFVDRGDRLLVSTAVQASTVAELEGCTAGPCAISRGAVLDTYTFVDPLNYDFHIDSAPALLDAGEPLDTLSWTDLLLPDPSVLASEDADGDVRGSTPDIGLDEVAP